MQHGKSRQVRVTILQSKHNHLTVIHGRVVIECGHGVPI